MAIYSKNKFMDWARTLHRFSSSCHGACITEKQGILARLYFVRHKGLYLWVGRNNSENIGYIILRKWGSTQEVYIYDEFNKDRNVFEFTEDDLNEISVICGFEQASVDLMERFKVVYACSPILP